MLTEAQTFKKNWQLTQKKLRESEADCAFVYVHLQEDTGEPFYVGIGEVGTRPWDVRRLQRSDFHVKVREKHGIRVEIVADNLTWEAACFWERRWIKALRDAGYRLVNMTDGGDGVINPSKESRDKKRAAWVGDNNPMKRPEVKAKIRASQTGRTVSEETKEKIRLANLGKRASEDTKKKLRARKVSPETIDKMKETHGKPEVKAKCATGRLGKQAPNKGKPMSDEQKEKLRAAWVVRKTRPISEETREKGRIAANKRWHPNGV